MVLAFELETRVGPKFPRPPPSPPPRTHVDMQALVDEGKVKHIGLSEVTPDEVRRAHAVAPVAAVELEWSLFSRDCEEEMLPVLRELGIGVLAYSPLGRCVAGGGGLRCGAAPQRAPPSLLLLVRAAAFWRGALPRWRSWGKRTLGARASHASRARPLRRTLRWPRA